MNFKVVIPARLGSTRLPRKVLREIQGRPMVRWVWEAASRSGAAEVVIATDSAEVEAACRGFGADVAMTQASHASGTDRINEVAQLRRWPAGAIVVNVQGDEPLMPPELVRQAAQLLADDPQAEIGTLSHPIADAQEWLNPNVVKVVTDAAGRALYFSRAPIPWLREGSSSAKPVLPAGEACRHIGIYAYRVAALEMFSRLPPASLEKIEALEQLRALANGMVIRVGIAHAPPPRGVDTEDDLRVIAKELAGR